jgi:hypothetical protein
MFRPNFHSDPIFLPAPLNRQHPLVRSLVSFVTPLPWRWGGPTAYDLVDGSTFALGSVTTWRGAFQRFGAWNFTGAAGSSVESSAQKFVHAGATLGKTLTMAIWYKTSAANGNYGFISINNNSSTPVFGILVVTAAISVDTNGTHNSYAAAFKNDGKWHCIVATWDGTTITAYQDGASLGTIAQTSSVSSTAKLTVGNRGAGTFLSIGDLNGAMFWNRTLSASDAEQVYLEGLEGYPTLLNRTKRSYGYAAAVAAGRQQTLSLIGCGA